ncbi:MAG TPA: hypothetical protein PLX06_07950, partial [Fimbriimonadaceae bacterium]|nr:hypothetical protein [Fimbriimonadaceae bacterium]
MRRTTVIRLRGALVLLATLVTLAPSLNAQIPIAYPDIALVKRDYSGNIQATDRDWFYLDEEGDPLTSGGGEHPSLEFDISKNRRPGPNVAGVVYTEGTTTITLVVTIYGELSEGVDCSFTMQGARLAVPAPNQSEEDWEYITLTPSPTTAQNWHWNAGNRTTTL